jgi:hypothetical protein
MCPVSRRRLLGEGLALGTTLALVRMAHGQDALLDPASAEAIKLKYVEDARQASAAAPDANCASCGLYQGKKDAATGTCQAFPHKLVKAAGWCTSWAPQM